MQFMPGSSSSDYVFYVHLSGSAGEAKLLCRDLEGLYRIGDPRTTYSWWNVLVCVELL